MPNKQQPEKGKGKRRAGRSAETSAPADVQEMASPEAHLADDWDALQWQRYTQQEERRRAERVIRDTYGAHSQVYRDFIGAGSSTQYGSMDTSLLDAERDTGLHDPSYGMNPSYGMYASATSGMERLSIYAPTDSAASDFSGHIDPHPLEGYDGSGGYLLTIPETTAPTFPSVTAPSEHLSGTVEPNEKKPYLERRKEALRVRRDDPDSLTEKQKDLLVSVDRANEKRKAALLAKRSGKELDEYQKSITDAVSKANKASNSKFDTHKRRTEDRKARRDAQSGGGELDEDTQARAAKHNASTLRRRAEDRKARRDAQSGGGELDEDTQARLAKLDALNVRTHQRRAERREAERAGKSLDDTRKKRSSKKDATSDKPDKRRKTGNDSDSSDIDLTYNPDEYYE